MKDNFGKHSLKAYTLVIVLIVMIVAASLIIYNNFYAYRLLRSKVYENSRQAVELYANQLETGLSSMESYLLTLANDNAHYNALVTSLGKGTAHYSSLHHLNKELQSSLLIYPASEFCTYFPASDTFLRVSSESSRGVMFRDAFRSTVSGMEQGTGWEAHQYDGTWFFSCINVLQKSRSAVIADPDKLLNKIGYRQSSDTLELYLSSDSSPLITLKNREAGLSRDAIRNTTDILEENGQEYMAVQSPIGTSGLYLTGLIPSEALVLQTSSLSPVLLIVLGLFFIIWGLLVLLINRQLLDPITRITKALRHFSGGELETQVSVTSAVEELQDMAATFNTMTTEIKDLKIRNYEISIARKDLELQYLKQQVSPHFMINCLNLAYQLETGKHTDLSRSMLRSLSKHLRFVLSSGNTIDLGTELSFIENYLVMSNIRYPNAFVLHARCPDELKRAEVVPLILLNFVENTVKHRNIESSVMEIHVEISRTERNGTPFLSICYYDTGSGFSEENLPVFQELADPRYDDLYRESREHVGVANTVLRTRQLFPESVYRFSNRPGFGAEIDIELPLREYPGYDE